MHWHLRDRMWPRQLLTVGLWFGQRGTVLVGSALLAGWLAWHRRTSEPILRLGVAVIALVVTVYAIKLGLARNAPAADARGEPAGTGSSYPSGHTANAILLWGLAGYAVWRWQVPRRLARLVSVGRWLAPWATSISMILLDYHWLSDLVAGIAVGTVVLWIALLHVWKDIAARVDTRVLALPTSRST